MSELGLSLLPSIEKEKIQGRCDIVTALTHNDTSDDAVQLLDSYLNYLSMVKPDEIDDTFEELKNCKLDILKETEFYKKKINFS